MFWRRRSSKDFAEEIKSHLEHEAEDLRREGFNEDEARRRARVEFGGVQSAEERFYIRHRVTRLDNCLRDTRFAIRQLLKNPGFALGHAAQPTTIVDVIRWDEKAGLRTGCCTLPSYRRARSTRDKGDRQ